MDFYKLSNGEIAGYDDSALVPADAVAITAEQFSAIATDSVLTLAAAQGDQIATLQEECAAAIVSGFSSTALGTVYQYPSTLTDQQNQNTVANCASGGQLWCSNGSTWGLTAHTQPEAQAVVASFAAWLNACQSQLVALVAKVSSATTNENVDAIVWESPA
jgi:hypothetical protein